jgi:hypothetical protein
LRMAFLAEMFCELVLAGPVTAPMSAASEMDPGEVDPDPQARKVRGEVNYSIRPAPDSRTFFSISGHNFSIVSDPVRNRR